MGKILEKVNFPKDIKNLSEDELKALAQEIREIIIETVSNNGGHLAPNLGAVELTIALHLALDLPEDKIVFDVGHQCYTHKIITGRKDIFATIRQQNGLSGFPKKDESNYDCFDTGHASNSISAALGMAKARDLAGADENIVAVIGDGSLTGGMAYEGLNQAGHQKSKLIVILNDNNMSIAKNVGAMSSYLGKIRLDPKYNQFKADFEERVRKLPGIGETVVNIGEHFRETFKHIVSPGLLFEELGFRYIGLIDGHDIAEIKTNIELAKQSDKPVLIHVNTLKGKGYKPAIENADTFHGTSPFVIETGKPKVKSGISYTSVFGDTMVKLGINEPKIVAITAAMRDGTGLKRFAGEFPQKFFDVGIAEQHAVTFAAGIATRGFIPVVAIYSTFLQRALDQVIQDVALQKLKVVFALDRAGLVGEDGPTHHGNFDLSYLREVPNLILMAPKDENELQHMLYSATRYDCLSAIRYPRGRAEGVVLDDDFHEISIGKAEQLKEGKDVVIWAVGTMVSKAMKTAEILNRENIDVGVVNGRFIKPIDKELLKQSDEKTLIVTLEENSEKGGFGSAILEALAEVNLQRKVLKIGLPDKFITHGDTNELLKQMGLNINSIAEKIRTSLNNKSKTNKISKILRIDKSV